VERDRRLRAGALGGGGGAPLGGDGHRGVKSGGKTKSKINF